MICAISSVIVTTISQKNAFITTEYSCCSILVGSACMTSFILAVAPSFV